MTNFQAENSCSLFTYVYLRNNGASTKERMDAATWFADRGFGKPTVNAAAQAPGIGDFTITIGDHDIMGNPINPKPIFSIKDADSID